MDANAYPNFNAEQLVSALTSHSEVIRQPGGSGELVFSVYGGRLLGLYPQAGGPNALWVNPELSSELANGAWLTGGERLWIAPERDFYYRKPATFEAVHVPAAIDPGHYTKSDGATENTQPDSISLQSRFDLHDFAQQVNYRDSRLKRTFRPIADPYQSGLDYCGVHIHEQIRLPVQRPFCAWSIAQVYIPHARHPATALIPTRSQAAILSYFDDIPAQRASTQHGYVSFRLDSAAIYKLAVRPEDLPHSNPVKALCVMPAPDSDAWLCVVKRSNDLPRSQQDCVDVARNPQTSQKGVVQSYNHGPEPDAANLAHQFGEIEIQLNPALYHADGSASSSGSHELLAYSGDYVRILTLAQRLLQLEQVPVLYT